MHKFPLKIDKRLQSRKQDNSFRVLDENKNLVDFVSNDYLGFSASKTIWDKADKILAENKLQTNGATGSRLLSGNHKLYEIAENYIANFHQVETALIFNSGFDANTGFFSSVPQRGDIILYDEFSHASIREGIILSNAKAFKFKHNDLEDLKNKLQKHQTGSEEIYVVTESVFSMDGDMPDLENLVGICEKHDSFLIVDEAHAVGVFGHGKGLIQHYGLQDRIFARIVTFGKALGCQGAAVLGSPKLKEYLINFARSFIYTTALPPNTVSGILAAYMELSEDPAAINKLHKNIEFFRRKIKELGLSEKFIESNSAIQSFVFSGNEAAKKLAENIEREGYYVKPILAPTVPKGRERLRFCLHSFNNVEEIEGVLTLLVDVEKTLQI